MIRVRVNEKSLHANFLKISENFLVEIFNIRIFDFSNFVEPEENILQMTSLHDSLVMTHGAQHWFIRGKSTRCKKGKISWEDERVIKRLKGRRRGEDKIWNDCNHVTQ